MATLNISVHHYSELTKIAKSVAIDQYIENGFYDYSEHEVSDYNQALTVFNAIFGGVSNLNLTGDQAKECIVACVNGSAQHQASKNPYYAKSFNEKYNSKITTVPDAIDISENCLLTGVCVDFYLLDPIIKFLKGTDHQDLNIKKLIAKARENGRKEIDKAKRFFKSRTHVGECLESDCDEYFFGNGLKVPPSFINAIQN